MTGSGLAMTDKDSPNFKEFLKEYTQEFCGDETPRIEDTAHYFYLAGRAVERKSWENARNPGDFVEEDLF